MADKPHLSASQLDMICTCAESYRRRYICGEKIPPGIAPLIGTGVHGGIEVNFGQKIESHVDLKESDIVDCAVAGLDDRMDEDGVELTAEETARGVAIVVGEARDTVAVLAGLYAREAAPEYQPLAVEKEVLIPMPNAPFDMLGYIDLVDDKRQVIDFKTGARAKSQSDIESSTQLTVYAASLLIADGSLPSAVVLDTLVKTKTPKRQVLKGTRTLRDVQALVARINTTILTVQAGVFLPAAPGSWKCSPRWCGYWSTCPYVNAERAAASAE